MSRHSYVAFLLVILSFLLKEVSLHAADSQWRFHPIFDEEVTHVVETPTYVYFTSRSIKDVPGQTNSYLSLFRYDKEGEELLPLSSSNFLNGNNVKEIMYNPQKGYLTVLYTDNNIDLINNNGKVSNISTYKNSNLTYSKDVNSISIDPGKDRIYLATNFGYVAINDKKNEIAESRIYGEPLKSFCRVGNYYYAFKGNELIKASVDSPHLSLDQFSSVATFDYPSVIYPLSKKVALIVTGESNLKSAKKLIVSESGEGIEPLFPDYLYFHNIEYTPDGVLASVGDEIYLFDAEANFQVLKKLPGYENSASFTSNGYDFWNAEKRKGLSRVKKSGEDWKVILDWTLPNSPATYITTNFLNHPKYGFLMLNNGYGPSTTTLYTFSPLQLSGLKNGRWKNYAPAYTNPERTSIITASNGFALDPDNSDIVYITSYHNGILRLNLSDPKDLLHLGSAIDSDNGNPGFVNFPLRPTSTEWANISAPFFDNKGNLWMVATDFEDRSDSKIQYYCWTKEAIKASKSASEVVMPVAVIYPGHHTWTNVGISIPLKKTGVAMMVYGCGKYNDEVTVIETNGTPQDTSDDIIYQFPEFYDSDGNQVSVSNIKYLWEDPTTGYVWVCHRMGVCYFVPSQVKNGNFTVHRIKVPRNDGTNLADYLLEGVAVNQITSDSQGRKWFSLADGGVVCTSSDGREILYEFDVTNSPLPSNEVYGIGYNSENNSMMISTSEGYTEYTLSGMADSSKKTDVRAYPNPVRPDFSGYVTITDIPEGSFVKITDVAGNLVRDLGIMNGFEILWDLSDSRYNRVRSGVYHIMVSPSSDSSSYSAVGKILVVS